MRKAQNQVQLLNYKGTKKRVTAGSYIVSVLMAFVFVLATGALNAQQQPFSYNIEVVYKMTYQPDSTNDYSRESEYVSLFVGQGQSLFCASQYLLMDSAIASEASKGNTFGPPMTFFMANGTHYSTLVFKTANDIITYDQVARFVPTVYKYRESPSELAWTMLSDTLTIGGIPCQRAETFFGNRRWIAWFAPSIPVSDGPYKFCGLPGLILSVNDDRQYWNFNLASIRKKDTTLRINFLNKIPQPIKDKKEFMQQKKYSRDNRFELMKLRGAKFSSEEYYIRYYKEQAKKDNNWIELYNHQGQ